MGILDNLMSNPTAMASLGLLSMPTRSREPLNPIGFALQGAMGAQQYKMQQAEMQQQAEARRLQEQQLRAQIETSAFERKQAALKAAEDERGRVAREQYLAGLSPPERALAEAYPEIFQAQMKEQFKPRDAWSDPFIDDSTGKPILVQRNEATGQLKSVGSGGVTVNMPETKHAVGDKANKYVMQDGSTPNPMMSVEEIVSAGGRVLTPAEITAQNRQATIGADDQKLNAQVESAQAAYDEAAAAFEKAKTPETIRNLRNAASKLQTAIAGRENWRGEPSDGVANRFTVPGPVLKTVEDMIAPALESLGGGKPNVRRYNPQTGMIE